MLELLKKPLRRARQFSLQSTRLQNMSTTDNIRLIIYSPERTILDMMVSKVSLPGTMGRFMVLKDHAPLISSLETGRITFVCNNVDENVDIESGFVEITYNKVTVCAEL